MKVLPKIRSPYLMLLLASLAQSKSFNEEVRDHVVSEPLLEMTGSFVDLPCPTTGAFKEVDGQCSKYLRCIQDTWLEFDCPCGLHWDTELENCVFADNSDCVERLRKPDVQSRKEKTAAGTSCAIIGSYHHVESQCNKFLWCIPNVDQSTTWHEFECQAGTHWNKNQNYCDHPANTKCGKCHYYS